MPAHMPKFMIFVNSTKERRRKKKESRKLSRLKAMRRLKIYHRKLKKNLTNLRRDQGVFPFRLADVDVDVVASTQRHRKL